MNVAVIGATGRTGRPLVEELLRRGHHVRVLARDPGSVRRSDVTVVAGGATQHDALAEVVTGTEAVLSALGPTDKDSDLHTRTAQTLVQILPAGSRFIGISGAGIDVPGDHKGLRDKVVSALIQKFGGAVVQDTPREYQVFAASDLDWTLARPPRLQDGPPTGSYYSNAYTPGRSSAIKRADLALFLADCLDERLYVRQAPFVSSR